MRKTISAILSCLISAAVCRKLYIVLAKSWVVPFLSTPYKLDIPQEGSPLFPALAFGALVLFLILSIALYGAIMAFSKTAAARFAADVLNRAFSFSDWRRMIRNLAAMILIMAVCVAAGTALLSAVYALPVEPIDRNVKESAFTIQEEGTYPTLYPWCNSQLDNWTDSVMLLLAADDTEAGLADRTLKNWYGHISGLIPSEELVEHYCSGTPFTQKCIYPRYWHGYLLTVKPLFSVMNLQSVRILNGCAQVLMTLAVCLLMLKRKHGRMILPFLITYLMLMPWVIYKSLQFSTCFYIYAAGVLALLVGERRMTDRRAAILFLLIGTLVAYFDFLTYPIATYCIPAAILIGSSPEKTLKERLAVLLRTGFGWCFGYAGMWVSKWFVGTAFTDADVIGEAVGQLKMRISNKMPDDSFSFSRAECIQNNIQAFFRTPFALLVILFLAVGIGIFLLRKNRSFSGSFERIVPYLLLAVLPFIWYAFALNHSFIHFWFTNKALSAFVMALMCAVAELAFSGSKKKPAQAAENNETE